MLARPVSTIARISAHPRLSHNLRPEYNGMVFVGGCSNCVSNVERSEISAVHVAPNVVAYHTVRSSVGV